MAKSGAGKLKRAFAAKYFQARIVDKVYPMAKQAVSYLHGDVLVLDDFKLRGKHEKSKKRN